MFRVLLLCLLWVIVPVPGWAQQQELTFRAQFRFYGDNTEFSNPFRDGETLLGSFGRLVLDVDVNDRATFRAGVFGNQRFGSTEAFELVRPVFSLIVRRPTARFVFGTLETVERRDGAGPDRTGLHGLLPVLQRESLAFTRPYEAGVQWSVRTPGVHHESWVNWQRLNRREREIFDAGVVSRFRLSRPLEVGVQFHAVHQGGQRSSAEPVADSLAGGPGVIVTSRVRGLESLSGELHGLISRHVPDREEADTKRTGIGAFARVAAERAGWRAHVIVWRACDFIKLEGDPNYQALRQDGTVFRRTRDYAETGLTRTFTPAPGFGLEASARLHRVEHHYEYSYRILGTVDLAVRVRR